MTDFTLTVDQYRWFDRSTKLLGVCLLAVGLDLGGTTAIGATIGLVGAALAVTTVFIESNP